MPTPAGVVSFGRRLELLRSAMASMRGQGAAVTLSGASLGPPLIVDAGELFTDPEQDVLRRRRGLAASVRRIVGNAAARGLARIRAVSRPTRRTGLFMSAWRNTRAPDASGLGLAIAYVNPTPYAGYVHRRGTARSQTVVNVHVRPVLDDVAEQLAAELQPIQRVVAAEVDRERRAGLL